jgi:hypothetical protein
MFPTSGPGAYVEFGVVLGTVISIWIGIASYVIGHRVGARTTLAARTMQDAQIMRADAERQWTIGQLPTMLLPTVPVRVRRPAPRSKRSNAT